MPPVTPHRCVSLCQSVRMTSPCRAALLHAACYSGTVASEMLSKQAKRSYYYTTVLHKVMVSVPVRKRVQIESATTVEYVFGGPVWV